MATMPDPNPNSLRPRQPLAKRYRRWLWLVVAAACILVALVTTARFMSGARNEPLRREITSYVDDGTKPVYQVWKIGGKRPNNLTGGQVVISEKGVCAAGRGFPKYWATLMVGSQDPTLRAILHTQDIPLFIGTLTVQGKQKTIIITRQSLPPSEEHLADPLCVWEIDPGSSFHSPTARGMLGLVIDQPTSSPLSEYSTFRMYAGTIDPNDRSHIIIRYEIDGREGFIDGWFKSNDYRLIVRGTPKAIIDLPPVIINGHPVGG